MERKGKGFHGMEWHGKERRGNTWHGKVGQGMEIEEYHNNHKMKLKFQ
jgi:hypothetical protein